VPAEGPVPLAPHAAGSFLCWSGHTVHWGSACARESAADPRTSMALVFRRADAPLAVPEASLSRAEVCGPPPLRARLALVAAALAAFEHWYTVPPGLAKQMDEFRAAGVASLSA
jgi:hypothetical protein